MTQGFCVFTTEYEGISEVGQPTLQIARDRGHLVLSKQLSLCPKVTGYLCLSEGGELSKNHDDYPINTILIHRVTRQQYKVVSRTPGGLITLTSQGGKSEFVYIKNAELHIYVALKEAA